VRRPRFDVAVPLNGYHWWYADGVSDDGQHGFTVIAFIGSVFSPYYKWARRKGMANPENHCAINVALYGRQKRWAMTERGPSALRRNQREFQVGPSALRWTDDRLEISIDEVGMPIPHRIKGTITISVPHPSPHTEVLEEVGGHYWNPIAPKARVRVDMNLPSVSWQGTAYVDNNWGATPLEDSFNHWTWARTPTAEGAEIVYDVTLKDGAQRAFALRFDDQQNAERMPVAAACELGKTLWRVARPVHSPSAAKLIATFEDTPFYARTLLRQSHHQEPTLHESLDLRRFANPIVQMLLPFRMPRRG
jgi:carotenoid 1,2-hydratase